MTEFGPPGFADKVANTARISGERQETTAGKNPRLTRLNWRTYRKYALFLDTVMQTNWTNVLNKDVVNMMLLEPTYPPCRDTGLAAPPTPLEKPRSLSLPPLGQGDPRDGAAWRGEVVIPLQAPNPTSCRSPQVRKQRRKEAKKGSKSPAPQSPELLERLLGWV